MTVDSTRQLDSQSIIRYANKFTLPLPDVFIESNKIEAKDKMEIYRDRVNGRDALILIPKKSVPIETPNES